MATHVLAVGSLCAWAQVVLMRWLDWHGQESGAVLRWGFLNSYFQTGIRNLLDTAILREGGQRFPACWGDSIVAATMHC